MSKVKCLACGNTIESINDPSVTVLCGCPNRTHVSGGMEHTKIGGVDLALVEVIEAYHAGKLLNDAVPIEQPPPRGIDDCFGMSESPVTSPVTSPVPEYPLESPGAEWMCFFEDMVIPYHRRQTKLIVALADRIEALFKELESCTLTPRAIGTLAGLKLDCETLQGK